MNYKKWLFSFSFFFLSSVVFSQINPDILVKIKGEYYFQDNIYSKKELASVLEVNPSALYVYQEYSDAKRWANIMGIASIVGLTSASILLIKGNNKGFNRADFIVTVLGGNGGIIIGASGILTLGIANRRLKKAVKIFNENNIPPVGVLPMKLNFQTTENGLGLVLNF